MVWGEENMDLLKENKIKNKKNVHKILLSFSHLKYEQ